MKLSIYLGLLGVGAMTGVDAAVFTSAKLDKLVPDNDPSGVSDVQTVSMSDAPIRKVTLTLTLAPSPEGAFNGDYYAYLTHDGGFSVLLNRTGRRDGSQLGYGDSGFEQVLFDDDAPQGDVHDYRLTLSGDHSQPLEPAPSPLSGSWAPDGRNRPPGSVLDSDARSATLASFNGLNPNGDWILFIADLSSEGTAMLGSWSLNITVVPEPASMACLAGLALLTFGICRGKTRDHSQS